MTALSLSVDDRTYRRRINAWALYDVANSAFVTTILAALMPPYFSAVAGATLPSAAIATQRWSLSLSIALFISAVLAPILGTMSDITRGKKVLLSVFMAIGAIASGLMVLVGTGDWLLAAILIIIARVGLSGSVVAYDSLLPHVAKPEDQDAVSTRGYALGYLGGGVLLAINVVMLNVIPDDVFGFPFEFAGVRLSLLSVALWWVLFSLPLFLLIPEPQSATEKLKPGENVITASFDRLRETLRDVRQYSDLFKFLIAFLIYNDGIGTIIGVAAIYGAELGFDTTELVLALLLVQFVGIPFSFMVGNLANPKTMNRHISLAFVLFNVITLPIVAITARATLTPDVTGAPLPPYATTGDFVGEGTYSALTFAEGAAWTEETVPADVLDTDADVPYLYTDTTGSRFEVPFNGQNITISYATGPDAGVFALELDGAPLLDDDGELVMVNAFSETVRSGVTRTFRAAEPGEHTLMLVHASNDGTRLGFGPVTVQPPERGGNLGVIIPVLLAMQVLAAAFALLGGGRLVRGLADTLNTKRTILLTLAVYAGIAVWGFTVNSTVEFWFLAWMVGIVQGASQALSRSLYASMSPAAKSGEFFGLFSVMSRFSAITGPLLFAGAVALFGQSRPAVLSLVALFVIGGYLLTQVDVEEGRRIAREEDQRLAESMG
ncbi:MAG: MFS transporter [Chloroflexota bacterium]